MSGVIGSSIALAVWCLVVWALQAQIDRLKARNREAACIVVALDLQIKLLKRQLAELDDRLGAS